MDINDLLKKGRAIWGDKKLTLEEIIIRLGVVTGDINRYARDKAERQPVNDQELQKELGNVIFSMIRWCDDLGLSPEACIELAVQAQANYKQSSTKAKP
jgi:hypothetical protein